MHSALLLNLLLEANNRFKTMCGGVASILFTLIITAYTMNEIVILLQRRQSVIKVNENYVDLTNNYGYEYTYKKGLKFAMAVQNYYTFEHLHIDPTYIEMGLYRIRTTRATIGAPFSIEYIPLNFRL